MATWEDGPEYAPLERPDQFSVPEVPPLEVSGPAQPTPPPAPAERPLFTGPAAAVAPLTSLVPLPQDQRDPQRPFEVVSSNLTSGGAWGAAHGSVPTQPLLGPAPGASSTTLSPTALSSPGLPYQALAPAALPSAASVPGATPPAGVGAAGATPGWSAPSWPGSGPIPAPGSFPAPPASAPPGGPSRSFPGPGTPEWFGPGPVTEHRTPERLDVRRVLEAATYGLIIVLVVGFLIPPLAPVLLVVAFLLCRQVKVAQVQVRRTFAVALASVGLFALLGLLTAPLDFVEWWDFLGGWSRLACLVALVVCLAQVYRRLRSRMVPPPPPAHRGPWG